MKKCLHIFLAIVVLFCMAPLTPAVASEMQSGTCGTNLTWELDASGTLTISGTGKMESYRNSYNWYAPWDTDSVKTVVIGDGVKSIGTGAFYSCDFLTSVKIGNGVEEIGKGAFEFCTALEKIVIPDSVTTIGANTFSECYSLATVEIGDGVLSIGSGAFLNCQRLSDIKLGSSVNAIGDGAFMQCYSLDNIVFPDSVRSIGDHAFYKCSGMERVVIPAGVISMGSGVFSGCYAFDIYYGGSEVQWLQLVGDSNNSWLDDTTVHYAGGKIEYKYTQTEIIEEEDFSKYGDFLSCAQIGAVIPGFENDVIPQSIAYRKDKKQYYISAYIEDEQDNSVILVIDADTKKYVGEYYLNKEDGSAYTGHAGGIAITDNNLFVTSGKNLARISLSQIDEVGRQGDLYFEDKIKLSLGDASLSFCNYSNGVLWTGNFYEKNDYSDVAYKKGNTKYNSLIMGYVLDEKTESNFKDSKKLENYAYDYEPDYVCEIPEKIQGITTIDDVMVLSQSYGRWSNSNVIIGKNPIFSSVNSGTVEVGGEKLNVKTFMQINSFEAPPMIEGVAYDGESVAAVFESAANKYRKTIFTKPTDNMWHMNISSGYNDWDYPILVLPGIMGSTLKDTKGLGIPVLTENFEFIPQDELTIVDTIAADTGAKDLISQLRALKTHFVYECPYDWRLDVDDIAELYLKPLIDTAKKQTGKDKVILVAHSMGGLVARSYIQSAGYDYDVDSLYMIGTPNEGSTSMIPLAEYGVPYDAAQATVLSYNYNKMTGEDFNKATAKEIHRFINNKVLSTAQLLPAYEAYYYDILSSEFSGEGLNSYLTNLNNDALSGSRYQKIDGKNKSKVRTILFASQELDTPQAVEVTYNGDKPGLLYTESFVKNKLAYMAQAALKAEPFVKSTPGVGDGTVLTYSAMPTPDFNKIWTINKGDYGAHMGMFGSLADTIVSYLTTRSKTMMLKSAKGIGEMEAAALQLDVSGAQASLVVNGQEMAIESSGLYIEDLQNGEYTINCEKLPDSSRITVQILYTCGEKTTQKMISFLNDNNSISFSVDNGEINIENKTVSSVYSVNDNGYTKLMWDETDNAEGYKVYAKTLENPQYMLLNTTTATEFLTDDIWLEDFDENCMCYCIVPVFENNSDGGYSESARNYNTVRVAFECKTDENSRRVEFTDLSNGSVTSWEWDFDNDGTVDSTEQNPTYTYEIDGIYDVKLTVSGEFGTAEMICEDAAKIGIYPVKLVVESDNTNIPVGEKANLYSYILMSDGSRIETENVAYVSGDDEIISVSENSITANAPGTVVVLASAEGFAGSIELYVEAESAEIILTTEGYGFVEGDGDYQIGETVLVCAQPLNGDEFLGWYENDVLVSRDLEYWFKVSGNTELTAVFTEKGAEYISTNDEEFYYDGSDVFAYINFDYVLSDCIAILAIYDEFGKMETFITKTVNKTDEFVEFFFPYEQNLEGYKYKIMFWRSMTTLKPSNCVIDGVIRQ